MIPTFDEYVEENYKSLFQRYLALGTSRPIADKLTMKALIDEWYKEYHNGK